MITTSQTATYTLVAFTPQTMGMVLQPYRVSPCISSMSLTASRTSEIMKAKPPYKMASRKNLCWLKLLSLKASANETFEKKMMRMVHAVNNEIAIFPVNNFFLKVVE